MRRWNPSRCIYMKYESHSLLTRARVHARSPLYWPKKIYTPYKLPSKPSYKRSISYLIMRGYRAYMTHKCVVFYTCSWIYQISPVHISCPSTVLKSAAVFGHVSSLSHIPSLTLSITLLIRHIWSVLWYRFTFFLINNHLHIPIALASFLFQSTSDAGHSGFFKNELTWAQSGQLRCQSELGQSEIWKKPLPKMPLGFVVPVIQIVM